MGRWVNFNNWRVAKEEKTLKRLTGGGKQESERLS